VRIKVKNVSHATHCVPLLSVRSMSPLSARYGCTRAPAFMVVKFVKGCACITTRLWMEAIWQSSLMPQIKMQCVKSL
jgi:hypothetical protein